MSTTTTITAIGATHSSKFVTQKMPAAGTTVATAAKDANLIDEICFLQNLFFCNEMQIYLVIPGNRLI
jgi:hypothetical protein